MLNYNEIAQQLEGSVALPATPQLSVRTRIVKSAKRKLFSTIIEHLFQTSPKNYAKNI